MRLIFNAPPNHILLPDGRDGQVVHGGQTFTSDNAEELLTLDSYNVSEAPENLKSLTRSQLDELAESAGLDPSDFSTKGDVIDALENTDQPEADGVGQNETDSEEE